MLPEPLTIERFEGANYQQRVLRLTGPLTAATSLPFQNALRSENAGTIILDLSHVPYMDSCGLGSLVGTYVSCQKSGRRMALSGINPRVWQLFLDHQARTILPGLSYINGSRRCPDQRRQRLTQH